MAEAVMCHYEGNVLTFTYGRQTKTMIHWVLQVLGGGCGIAGTLLKMVDRGFAFSSTHGKLGKMKKNKTKLIYYIKLKFL